MPLVQTRGAASAQGFGEFAQAAAPANWIDDVFSTFLYTGTGAAQTITNGIDLAGKGGMVWTKSRSAVRSNNIVDTVRGGDNMVYTDATDAQFSLTGLGYSAFTFSSTGFVESDAPVNAQSGATFCSWTFREQAKFFDVVTYTGDGSAPRDIAHSLGSSPGFIIVKRTNSTGDWWCWHRSIANKNIYLNYSDGADSGTNPMISAVSSTNFTLATNQNATMNISGATYVAYLFAHDAGGFGTAGTDNVISCGSFTTDGAGNFSVNLGYEPQYVLMKAASGSYPVDPWYINDVMRGFSKTNAQNLVANSSAAESATGNTWVKPNATGFATDSTGAFAPTTTYIYMAIRRPMKPPTSGTQVFSPIASSAALNTKLTTGFPVDLQMVCARGGNARNATTMDRLRGVSTNETEEDNYLVTSSTAAEVTTRNLDSRFWDNTGFRMPSEFEGEPIIFWNFRRASGFFDEVCFSGNYSATNYSHNLAAVPEMIIFKKRTGTSPWPVYHIGVPSPLVNQPNLNATGGYFANEWFSSTPTSLVFSTQYLDSGTSNYVAYLFATLAGVSKVGSYTGTGATQTINCGFTAGARFVLIKRTDSTGDWWVWDTARGMVTSTDPRLALNSTAAELNNDWVLTTSTGFQIVTTDATINASGGTYIFLAIA